MYQFKNINFAKDKEKILKKVYEDILHTYEPYFKKYGKKRWDWDRFQKAVTDMYQISVYKGSPDIYIAVSIPKNIDGRDYFKIGFWTFDKNVIKNREQKRKLLYDGIKFLENRLSDIKGTIFIEIPYDFDPVRNFYENVLEFERCCDKEKVERILREFDMQIEKWDEDKYRTIGNHIYHYLYEKEIPE